MVVGAGYDKSEFAGTSGTSEAVSKYYNSDKVITVDAGKKAVEYVVENIEDSEYTTTYMCKYGNQSDIRFTYYKNENYLKFENRDNFTGKVGELQYYFKD